MYSLGLTPIIPHGYVLMSNHYHLIVETPQGNLLKVMHGINGRYTGYFNRKYDRAGHLFQGRYKGILVDKDAYLVQLSRYVHLNPVRAGMVDRPEQYRWSSYPAYGGKEKEQQWMEYGWVLSKFATEAKSAKIKYRAYVEEGLSAGIESPYKDLHGQVVLGGEEFIKNVKRMLKGKPLSREITERKRLKEQILPAEIMKKVAGTFGLGEHELKEKGRRDNMGRKVSIYFIQRYTGLSNEEIGRLFGGIHFSAVSKASAGVREVIARDKKLSKIIEGLDSTFKA